MFRRRMILKKNEEKISVRLENFPEELPCVSELYVNIMRSRLAAVLIDAEADRLNRDSRRSNYFNSLYVCLFSGTYRLCTVLSLYLKYFWELQRFIDSYIKSSSFFLCVRFVNEDRRIQNRIVDQEQHDKFSLIEIIS